MGVDHADDRAAQLRQLLSQLVGEAVAGAGVDDDQARIATDDPDGLIEVPVAPDPDPLADLAPDRGHVPRRTAVPDAVTMSMPPLPTVS
jgi:hypothetical protein